MALFLSNKCQMGSRPGPSKGCPMDFPHTTYRLPLGTPWRVLGHLSLCAIFGSTPVRVLPCTVRHFPALSRQVSICCWRTGCAAACTATGLELLAADPLPTLALLGFSTTVTCKGTLVERPLALVALTW